MERNDFEIEARRMRPRLYHQALRFIKNADDAEDVTQETLLKLWSMRQQLEEYHSVEALAMVITKHLCMNRLRATTYIEGDLEKVAEVTGNEMTPEEAYIDKENGEKLNELMKTLPSVQQATLRMKHIDGMEIGEIARITGSTEVTVRSNLSRARKKILNYFSINEI